MGRQRRRNRAGDHGEQVSLVTPKGKIMKVTSSRRTSVSESEMPKWLPHPGVLITGDVVRWREPVWSEKQHMKKYWILGERRVTAAVLAMDSTGLLRLSILEDPMKRFKKD